MNRYYHLEIDGETIDVQVEEDGGLITSSISEGVDDPQLAAALDGLESLILAHACEGIDITSPAYKEGIQTALEAIGNNY